MKFFTKQKKLLVILLSLGLLSGIGLKYFKGGFDKEEIEIDSRTSDAIAIAIRFSCPIFTYEDILSRASILTVSSYGKGSEKSNIIEKMYSDQEVVLGEMEVFTSYNEDNSYLMKGVNDDLSFDPF